MSYNDPRIKYIKNETNLKLIKTLNKGIDLAIGKYIARMDADDISLPNRFQVEYEFMESNPEISVCSSLIFRMLPNNRIRESYYFEGGSPEGCRFKSIFRVPLSHPASFFRAEVLKEFKYKDSADALHIEDFALWGDLTLSERKLYVIPQRLLYYRESEQSVSHAYNAVQIENTKNRVRFMLKQMLDIEITEEVLDSMYDMNDSPKLNYLLRAINLVNTSRKVYLTKFRTPKETYQDIEKAVYCIKRGILGNAYRGSFGLKKAIIAFFFLLVKARIK